MTTVVGEGLPTAERLRIVAGSAESQKDSHWVLRGTVSNERYVTRPEKQKLAAVQERLGRPEAIYAALIPVRKSAAWWELTQDQRREIFEERSHHIEIGLKYLPPVARRLHHCRDLGWPEPFDFLTWFEYVPSYADAFEELTAALRKTEEWKYVDREIDIRLVLEP